MPVTIKRAYEPANSGDGYRVLVDALWPRGVSREKLKIDEWMKEIAPSSDLRKWYQHRAEKWPEFRERYKSELQKPPASNLLRQLVQRARKGKVTLVIGARDIEHANGTVIAELIRQMP
ncbi:MAG TPA: DUF488 family protein [Terriglobia bacterium]|nr:DUF488 family protein [Terriglobia bacterium]